MEMATDGVNSNSDPSSNGSRHVTVSSTYPIYSSRIERSKSIESNSFEFDACEEETSREVEDSQARGQTISLRGGSGSLRMLANAPLKVILKVDGVPTAEAESEKSTVSLKAGYGDVFVDEDAVFDENVDEFAEHAFPLVKVQKERSTSFGTISRAQLYGLAQLTTIPEHTPLPENYPTAEHILPEEHIPPPVNGKSCHQQNELDSTSSIHQQQQQPQNTKLNSFEKSNEKLYESLEQFQSSLDDRGLPSDYYSSNASSHANSSEESEIEFSMRTIERAMRALDDDLSAIGDKVMKVKCGVTMMRIEQNKF